MMTRRRMSVALAVVVLLGGCSPAETPETAANVPDMGLETLQQRAEQGHADAQSRLGYMYDTGEGVPQDDVEAVRWFRLAAEQGHELAQYLLGRRYANGRGVPQDDVEAVRWFRLAAEQGLALAQHLLGLSYSVGQGVAQDVVEAHKWANLSAARTTGDARELSVKVRDALAELMTPEQLAEAQKLAREWQAAFDARQE